MGAWKNYGCESDFKFNGGNRGNKSLLFIGYEKLKIVLPTEKSFTLYSEGTW